MNRKNEIIGLPLKVLILEDSIPDFELIQEQLAGAGFILDITHAVNEKEFISALNKNHFYDIILSDFNLPGFDAFGALQISKKLCPEVPFICISGSIGEETAIELLKQGAVDYVLKDRPERLPFAIKRALEEAQEKITRRKMEESLRISEEKYRTIFENVQDVFYQTDLHGIIKEISPSIKYFADFNGVELIGTPVINLYNNPVDREKLLQLLSEEGEVRDFEISLKTKNHEIKYASINARLIFNSEGIPDHIDGALRDISERKLAENLLKQSEERFRDIVFSTVDWVWEVDRNGKYTYSSQKGIELLGYPHEFIIGKTAFDFMPEEEAKRVSSVFAEIVAHKAPIKDIENWNIRKNGELICLLTNGLPIFNDEGELVGYRGIDKDITERKRFEQQLIKAKEKAEESDRLKSAFLANMSHEIRTPMNSILGFTDLLLNPDLNSEERENFIKIVHKSGQRMLNTVTDIVEISKIEAGIVSIRNQEIDINSEVEEMVHFFKPEANVKGLNLMIDLFLPDNKKHIETDKDKLYSIISNLIKNAIKYSESGTIKVGCGLNDSLIEFYVKDTGIGIPAHRQEAIFNRFEQADIADTRVFEGSGLGLAIAKSYVEMLGGKIWVESKEGIGSTFNFTLPVKRNLDDNSSTEKKNLSKYEKSKSLNRRLKILIVEDDETSRNYLSILVNDFSKEIMEAETGDKALELCQKYKDIDLILMDIQLPGMNGYEATRQIREFNKDVIIIAQTAFALSGDKEKAIEAGCNDYISKPVNTTKLQSLLQKYFG